MNTVQNKANGTRSSAGGRVRKAVLPLLIATILGSGAVAAPSLYAASDAAATQDTPAKVEPVAAAPKDDKAMPSVLPTDGAKAAPGDTAEQGKVARKGDEDGAARLRETVAQVSQEGMGAMQALHAARLSIFEGQTDAAKEQIGQAEKLLMQAKGDAATVQKKGDASGQGKDGPQDLYIPIDGTISLADAFVPTDAHRPALEKAQEQVSGKDTAGAIDTLQLAAIDITYTQVLMPLESTEQHVKEAQGLLEQGKFHEANLAMLKAEQGIVINSVEMAGPVAAQNG